MKELCRERGRVSLKQLIGITRLCVVCRCSGLEIERAFSLTPELTNSLQLKTHKHHTSYCSSISISHYSVWFLCGQKVCLYAWFHLHVKGVTFSLELGCFVFGLLYPLISLCEDLLKSSHLLLQGLDLLSFRHDVLHLPWMLHTNKTGIRYEIWDWDQTTQSVK